MHTCLCSFFSPSKKKQVPKTPPHTHTQKLAVWKPLLHFQRNRSVTGNTVLWRSEQTVNVMVQLKFSPYVQNHFWAFRSKEKQGRRKKKKKTLSTIMAHLNTNRPIPLRTAHVTRVCDHLPTFPRRWSVFGSAMMACTATMASLIFVWSSRSSSMCRSRRIRAASFRVASGCEKKTSAVNYQV